jgi:multidrug efflux pump
MRRTLGIAVFSGMLGVTIFGIFLTPVFFNVVDAAGDARIFHSKAWRWIRLLTLGIFALGFLRLAVRKALELRNGTADQGPADENIDEFAQQERATEEEGVASAGP